ncbi:protein XRI1-like isoform X2 [Rutidosis leptorrhynchoides]|uniref:protein XRI1-like isoform X2 n=1 Tax=Rutidosis leptorrhynchoides TaxID=125765 RepID=UPI003A99C4BE
MDHNINNHNNDEMWDFKGEDYGLQLDIPNSLWNNVSENDDVLSYVFNDTTPVKSCGDLAYQVTDNENVNKDKEVCRDASSQSKRRRMLHFDEEVLPLCDEDFSSIYLKSKEREDSLDRAFSDMSQWMSEFADDMSTSASGHDGLEQISEGWLEDCLVNDSGMHFSPDDLNLSETSDMQTNLTDSNSSQPENRDVIIQSRQPPIRQNVIIKGKKSLIKRPAKMTSSVVLPFAFVKPCGVQGAVTLKDINQKIHTPSKSKKPYEDPTIEYPKSAFSGKPIVGKTKIRTEGGKGSITIMRTIG